MAGFVYTAATNNAIIEPHWFYFSSIGFFILAAYFFNFLNKKFNHRLGITICLILGIMIIQTRKSNAFWKDEATYCNYWLELNPLNGTARSCKAKLYIEEHDRRYNRLNYNDCNEAADLAGAFYQNDQNEKAASYYIMALEMNPQCLNALSGLADLYIDTQNFAQAEKILKTLIDYYPEFYPAYPKLIEVYEEQGKIGEADKIRASKVDF